MAEFESTVKLPFLQSLLLRLYSDYQTLAYGDIIDVLGIFVDHHYEQCMSG